MLPGFTAHVTSRFESQPLTHARARGTQGPYRPPANGAAQTDTAASSSSCRRVSPVSSG
jgi:hypothetical protein